MMAAIIRTKRWKSGDREMVSYLVETRTHVAEASRPVYGHMEYLMGFHKLDTQEILGVPLKPVVRVRMGSDRMAREYLE